MSFTNLVLGGNWGPGEWPEFVEVSHGSGEVAVRYVPEDNFRRAGDNFCRTRNNSRVSPVRVEGAGRDDKFTAAARLLVESVLAEGVARDGVGEGQ